MQWKLYLKRFKKGVIIDVVKFSIGRHLFIQCLLLTQSICSLLTSGLRRRETEIHVKCVLHVERGHFMCGKCVLHAGRGHFMCSVCVACGECVARRERAFYV